MRGMTPFIGGIQKHIGVDEPGDQSAEQENEKRDSYRSGFDQVAE